VCGQELQTALHLAARQGDADGVELLLERGAAPNTVTADLNTPLHGAAREGHDHVVRLLIDHGANMELANKVRATDALRRCVDVFIYFFILTSAAKGASHLHAGKIKYNERIHVGQ